MNLDSYRIEAKFDGANWVDISADVVGNIGSKYGIFGSDPKDRVGDPGEFRLTLNNSRSNSAGKVGYYTPGHGNCRSGFWVGLPIRLVCVYQGISKIKGYGRITRNGIRIRGGANDAQFTDVIARDILHEAEQHELVSPDFATSKKIEDVAALIVANMRNKPVAVSYGNGTSVFDSVFDTTRSTTRAMTEFSKVVMSEMGYLYIRRGDVEERLVVEGIYDRNDYKTELTGIPADSTDYLLLELGDGLLLEDGGGILLEANSVVSIDNAMASYNAVFGNHVYNRIKLTSYPRKVDALATTVLFETVSRIRVSAGETLIVSARYSDPEGKSKSVTGIDMGVPVSGTDYDMNTAEDGSGSDTTSDLDFSYEYSSTGVIYTLTNNNGDDGYVWVKATGRGVYLYDAVDVIVEDLTSIENHGVNQLSIDQKYQDDPLEAQGIANHLLSDYKDPKMVLSDITFYANRREELLLAFLHIEPGDRVGITENVSNSEGDYFIQGVEYSVRPGGMIECTWFVKYAGHDSYTFAVWDLDAWDDGSKWGF